MLNRAVLNRSHHVYCQIKQQLRRLRWLGLWFLGGLILALGISISLEPNWTTLWATKVTMAHSALAQTSAQDANSTEQLVQQGVDQYQQGNYAEAITTWQTALGQYQGKADLPKQAIVLENLARAYQTTGQFSQAISTWEQATTVYRSLHQPQMVGRMLSEQAQTYIRLGQYRKSIALLCAPTTALSCTEGSALQIAQSSSDPVGSLAAWGSLGEAYRLRGDYQLAIQALEQGSAIAEDPTQRAALFKSLGNVYSSLAQVSYRRASSAEQLGELANAQQLRQTGEQQDRQALAAFQQSLDAVPSSELKLRILIDTIPAAYRVRDPALAQARAQQALTLLTSLPDTPEKAYAAIDLSRLLQPPAPNQRDCPLINFQTNLQGLESQKLLQTALTTAQTINDSRSESFALGELGHWHECRGDIEQALQYTQQARQAAEQEPDSRYLWEWQNGRIVNAQEQSEDAVALYQRSVQTLETIRNDILTAKRDIQFDFRDTIEPLYRELVELDLEQADPQSTYTEIAAPQASLTNALKTLDGLKLAELQNYFGNDCVLTAFDPAAITSVKQATDTATFSSIILPNRMAIVVTFPNGQQQLEWIAVDQATLTAEINDYRRGLERFFDASYNPQQAQVLYDRLIRPFAANLEQAKVKTLIFVQDGILRSVPMTALHDGSQFLIQRYAIATTPSLTLTDPNPFNRRDLKALAMGLSERATVAGQTFEALTNVKAEIEAVTTILPNSKTLLDQSFTRDQLQQALDRSSYPIVHVATHGEFGTEPEETFLVTGNNQKLTLNDLDQLLRLADTIRPIELLTLTACETAVGDDRAALGLAGVAAQAGTKSVLASLWAIDDAATPQLIDRFYQLLQDQPELSKATAFQMAQRALIEAGGEYAHPAYWAAFVLIGNWL